MIKWASLAAAVVFAGTTLPVFAADDGYENVFSSVLTAVGVLPPSESPDIDYRERAPLVLPPSRSLVKPQQAGGARSAAWPVDPDVVRRQKAAADAKAPRIGAFNRPESDRPMSKEEQLKFRAAQDPDADPYRCKMSEKSMSRCYVGPDEMKAEEERYKKMNPDKGSSDVLTAGVEPDREYLTQPPKGYMKATKTVAATHEPPKPKRDESSPLSTYIHPVETNIDPLSN